MASGSSHPPLKVRLGGENPGDPPAFASSTAYEILKRDLVSYLRREVHGRSFLVAGHRGAGKTSMVLRVIDDLRRESRTIRPEVRSQRPLLVRLHGPSMLAQLATVDSATATPHFPPDNVESDPSTDRPINPMEGVLRQMMSATYRAFATEAVEAYRACMKEKANKAKANDGIHEAVAQLQLGLDNAPPPEELREYWRRAGALSTGVLWSDKQGHQDGQGARELVALSTAAQAYRIVSGTTEDRQVRRAEREDEQSFSTSVVLAGRDIANKLMAVLTGGLVGGAFFANDQTWTAAVVGLAVTFVSAWGFNYSSTRRRRRSNTEEYTFIRDRSITTLDRELPVVIERMREAGLAPVFVIDELDKLDDLETAMEKLVQRLKHIVTDRFFVCFMTDRDYFENLSKKLRDQAYPKEHTYFSNHLFISYRPEDIAGYLRQVLVLDKVSGEPRDKVLHLELVAFLLRHRARLHLYDIHKELTRYTDQNDEITLSLEDFRSNYALRTALHGQLAVEVMLADPRVAERISNDTQARQTYYDMLFYLFRALEDGEEVIDGSKATVYAKLAERLQPGCSADFDADGESRESQAERVLNKYLSARELELLMAGLEKLTSYLKDPKSLRKAFDELDADNDLREALGPEPDDHERVFNLIPTGEQSTIVAGPNGKDSWRFDYYGRPFEAIVSDDQNVVEASLKQLGTLIDLNDQIANLFRSEVPSNG